MTTLSVTPEDGEGQAYGKTVSELQEGIEISDGKISGTLHYVKGYTGFAPTDNDGNFIALKLEYPEDATMKCEVVNGTAGEKTIPKGDHSLVCKIADKDTQKIKLTIEKDGQSDSVTYDLSGLTLEEDDG